MLAHASELASTPGEQWPLIKERQAKEILAVRDGNLDITDRRSWQWPYLPETLHRIRQPIIKNLPYNVRRFARTPVPRRAINLIKNSIIALNWGIVSKDGDEKALNEDTKQRIAIATKCFEHPNNQDSFQSFTEAGVDDLCINGAFVIEPQLTPSAERPFKMWNVDSSTIRIFPNWKESDTDQPHYAQMTGLKGERGIIVFYDDELIYMKDNPSVDSPFGLGKMEVAFSAVNSFVGVQEMAGRAGSDQVHKTWLWWEQAQAPHNIDIIRRHIMNDLEGQSKLSLIAGMKAPTPIEVTPVTVDDLLLPWQEMLIRMIGNAFDMSAMALNLERDVNRSTGEVLDDKDFRSAVLPIAVKIAEGYTRYILHRLLGWTDLQFKWLNLDDPDAATKMTLAQQLFACNAVTPNQIRKSMGLPPSTSPFADLTQFEMLLINTEVASKLQGQQQDQQFNRQLTMMQLGQPGDEEQGQEPTSAPPTKVPKGKKTTQAAGITVPKLTQPKMPKLLQAPTMPSISLPKMPMAGSVFSAKQVAAMSFAQFANAVKLGYVPKDKRFLAQQMETQEPGILEQLSDELKEYFQELEEEEENEQQDDKVKISKKQKEEQLAKYNKRKHRPADVEKSIYYQGKTKGKNRFPDTQNIGTDDKRRGGELGTRLSKKPGRLS